MNLILFTINLIKNLTKNNFILSALTVFTQYYDYHLFGFLATNIASHFFPAEESLTQLIYTYLIMVAAMIAKPVGAIILGKIGDIKGRSNSFKISLIGTAIASIFFFFTPGYESIGLLSCLFLLLYRIVICGFVSSGSDGVRIYIYEHMPKSKQCFGVGVTALFTQTGTLTASISAWFFTLNSFPEYSWKFAFLIGGFMGLAIVVTMQITNFADEVKVKDSLEFDKFKNSSIKELILQNWQLFFLCLVLAGCIGSVNQFLIIFFGTYSFEVLKIIDRSSMQIYTTIAILCYMIFGLISGYFADKFNRYQVASYGAITAIIFAILLMIKLYNLILIPWAYIAITIAVPFITIPAAAILKQSIPVTIRYRLFSLSHAIGSVFISAPTPLLLTFMYQQTNLMYLPIWYFILMILVISFVLYLLNKRIKRTLKIYDNKNTVK